MAGVPPLLLMRAERALDHADDHQQADKAQQDHEHRAFGHKTLPQDRAQPKEFWNCRSDRPGGEVGAIAELPYGFPSLLANDGDAEESAFGRAGEAIIWGEGPAY